MLHFLCVSLLSLTLVYIYSIYWCAGATLQHLKFKGNLACQREKFSFPPSPAYRPSHYSNPRERERHRRHPHTQTTLKQMNHQLECQFDYI